VYVLLEILIVVASSIWVHQDAKRIGVKKGQVKGLADLSPVGWLIACLGVWVISFPIYLLKRKEFMRINEKTGNTTAVAAGGIATIATFAALAIIATISAQRAMLEETAAQLVTQIIREQLKRSAQCARVHITDKVNDNLYKATATLDNGNDLSIAIETKDGMVKVQITR
jgi:ribosomal protein L31E